MVFDEIVAAGFNGERKDTRTGWLEPSAYIQWKGTDVCMDFHCECGAFCHFDGDFAYTVKCPHCGTIWEMPFVVYPRRATVGNNPYWAANPKLLEPDEGAVDENGNPQPMPAT